MIGSAVGPAPYPALVRDLQRVIGDEARAQMLEPAGGLPDRVVACVGGGSNAIGIFCAVPRDEDVELVGVEAGGEGLDAPARRVARRRARGCPARRALLGPPGRRRPDPRGALDLGRARLPRRRARARVPARHRPRALRVRHRRRGARGLPRALAARGHHPGARARARDRLGAARARRRPAALTLVTLSGRGDKDLAEVLAPAMPEAARTPAGPSASRRPSRGQAAAPR